MKKIKNLLQPLIVFAFCSSLVNAHDSNGSLGDSASATDILAISCENSTTNVYFQFFSYLPKGEVSDLVVSAQLLGGKNTLTVTDESVVDTFSSRPVDVNSNGLVVLINKNKPGKANYAIQYHCETAAGEHTDTEITQLQNQ